MFRFYSLVLAGAALAALHGSPLAQEKKIVLRIADHYPVGAPTAQYTAKHFMDSVRQATKGAVDFHYYPTEQLGKAKDFLSLTLSGVTDIAFVGPSYVSDKMPLSGVAELPGTYADSCTGTAALLQLLRGGILEHREFAPNGVRALLALALPPYQILTKGKLDKLTDLEGLKLRSGGGAMDLTVRRLKAVPVRIPGPEVHESLTRGTLDGIVFPLAAVLQFNLQDPLRSMTVGENFGGFAVTYVISESRWKQLSPEVQKAMLEAGESTSRYACQMANRDNEPAFNKLKERGVKPVELSPEDKAKLKQLLAPVHTDWAEGQDKRGKPGSEVLKAFLAAVGRSR